MSAWSKLKNMLPNTEQMKRAGKIAARTGKSLQNQKRDIQNDGVAGWMKGILRRFKNKVTRRAMKVVLRSLWHFLITPIWGWVVSAILILLLLMVSKTANDYFSGDSGGTLDNQDNNGQVTLNQYAALNQGCAVGGGNQGTPADSQFTPNSGINGGVSDTEVMEVLNSSVSATWGIPVSKAEAWFLTRPNVSGVIARYGITKSNIGQLSDAFQQEHISPVWMYMYMAIEGADGQNGYINNTPRPGDMVTAAHADAKHLYEVSMSDTQPVATGSGVGDFDTTKATAMMKAGKPGTIIRGYTPMTAAATGNLEKRFANVSYSGNQGQPFDEMVQDIKSMGGDPAKGGSADMPSTSSNNCGQTSQNVSGGMNLQQATAFMKKYLAFDIKSQNYYNEAVGTTNDHANCTLFSGYFVTNFTDLKWKNGDGHQIVPFLSQINNIKTTDTPSVYDIFSVEGDKDPKDIAPGGSGHTGVILGIDQSKGVAILGEAMYGQKFDPNNMNYWVNGVNATEWPLSDMTAKNGWSFLPTTGHLKQDKLNAN